MQWRSEQAKAIVPVLVVSVLFGIGRERRQEADHWLVYDLWGIDRPIWVRDGHD
jgi:hypothetical protein